MAFSVQFNYISKRIVTACTVINPLDEERFIKCRALWDTGATTSGMTKQLAEGLGLLPVSTRRVSDFHGTYDDNVYWVKIRIGKDIIFPLVEATEGNLGDCDFLIGMDIISKGDLCICNEKNETSLSFMAPSGHRVVFE